MKWMTLAGQCKKNKALFRVITRFACIINRMGDNSIKVNDRAIAMAEKWVDLFNLVPWDKIVSNHIVTRAEYYLLPDTPALDGVIRIDKSTMITEIDAYKACFRRNSKKVPNNKWKGRYNGTSVKGMMKHYAKINEYPYSYRDVSGVLKYIEKTYASLYGDDDGNNCRPEAVTSCRDDVIVKACVVNYYKRKIKRTSSPVTTASPTAQHKSCH